MPEIDEKLVEEIAGIIGAGRYECDPEGDLEEAKYSITLIAQAIADGEVKLPGEVGRRHRRDKHLPLAAARYWIEDVYREGANLLIAFRLEEKVRGGDVNDSPKRRIR